MASEHEAGTASLALNLVLRSTTTTPGEPTAARLVLTNRGGSPVTVNARMSLGYPDTSDRDLYLEIFREGGERYEGYRSSQVDYRPEGLSPASFRVLEPGAALAVGFDLQEWYRLREPGTYRITGIYAPQPCSDRPGAFSGRIDSPPETLRVLPDGPG